LLFDRDAPVTTDEKPPAGQDDPEPPKSAPARGDQPLPPLLKRILDEYSAYGLPPAYALCKKEIGVEDPWRIRRFREKMGGRGS
jgi:hypothetical protein